MRIAYLDPVPDKYKLEIICEELKKYAAEVCKVNGGMQAKIWMESHKNLHI